MYFFENRLSLDVYIRLYLSRIVVLKLGKCIHIYKFTIFFLLNQYVQQHFQKEHNIRIKKLFYGEKHVSVAKHKIKNPFKHERRK